MTEDGLPTQVSALAKAVMSYAANIDNVSVLTPTIERIAHKHISRNVQPEQYEAVGECLLYAMREVLGTIKANDDVMSAWKEAFGFLANTFVQVEAQLRAQLEEKAGFSGLTDMRVTSIDRESDITPTSNPSSSTALLLGLKPVHHDTPPFEKGQFVAIDVTLDNGVHTMTSMRLVPDISSEHVLTIRVPKNDERSTAALRDAAIGDIFKVSLPCGKPQIT